MMSRQRTQDDRGSSTLEFVIWTPFMLLVIGLLIVAVRVTNAGNTVESAAGAAARAASISRTPAAAQSSALQTASDTLSAEGVHCVSQNTSVDTSRFAPDLGQTGTVSVDVECTVSLSQAGLPFLPGTAHIKRSGQSPVDAYRQRTAP